jgi:hypothetical protein
VKVNLAGIPITYKKTKKQTLLTPYSQNGLPQENFTITGHSGTLTATPKVPLIFLPEAPGRRQWPKTGATPTKTNEYMDAL